MHQPILQEQPFFKIVFPLILGILCYAFWMPSKTILLLVFGVLFLLFSLSFLKESALWGNYISSSVCFLMFFSLGLLACSFNSKRLDAEVNNVYIAKLSDLPVKKANTWKANLQLVAKRDKSLWQDHDQKVLAYFENNIAIEELKAGNEIIIKSELQELDAPKNPFEFSFKRYLALKNIQYRVYLRGDDWKLLSRKEKGIKQIALNIREKVIDIYKQNGLQGDQLAVFSALTLGYKDKLDAKLKSAYSGAGAMHVLAVSGMHVGIVYLVLDWLFKLITFFNKKNRVKYLVIILLLWGYAMVTGLSTSVLRATIMFSFILFGYIINKRPNVYNSLAASALLLLLINPNYLYEVGFQLSYVAVAGIVFLYPKIYKLVYVPTKILDTIWQLTALSFAAQLSTFPISIYYFKQFASYFWLSNIVVSIAAIVLLFAAFLLVISSPFSMLSGLIGKLTNGFVEFINSFIFKVNLLPNAVIKEIDFSSMQLVFTYLTLAFFISWLLYKKYKMLVSTLIICLILMAYNINNYLHRNDRTQICIYNIPKASAIQFVKDHTAYWIIKNEIKDDFVGKANMFWKTNVSYNGNEEFKEMHLIKKNFIAFYNYRGLIIDEDTRLMRLMTNDSIELDFILVRGNPSISINDLPGKLIFETLIVDASVPVWKRKQWINRDNVCAYETYKDGMYLLLDNQ